MTDAPPSAPKPRIPPIEPLVTYQPEWSQWVRQMMLVFLIIATLFGLLLLTPVLQTLITTFLLAFLLYVPAHYIAAQTDLHFRGGVVVTYLILLLCIVLIIVIVIPSVVGLIRTFPDRLAELQVRAVRLLRDIPPNSVVVPVLNLNLEFVLEPLRQALASGGVDATTQAASTTAADVNFGQIISVATGLATGLLGAVSSFIGTAFLSVFLSLLILIDLPNYQTQLFNAISAPYHREMRILMARISKVWRGFFQVQVTVGIIIGVLTALQLAIMGSAEPIGVAVVVAIISLIPSIGGFFALVPLAIVPLISGSTVFPEMSNVTFALLVVGVNLVWTQVIWNVVAPKLMGDAISLPLPLIIIGIGIGAALGGILGAFLIVPIAGTLRILVLYIIAKINTMDPFPGQTMPEIVDLDTL